MIGRGVRRGRRRCQSARATTRRSTRQILLLNIARLSDDRPPHFTVTSSIAATFNQDRRRRFHPVFEGAGTDDER
ncbi:MAG: hypothetical protein U1E43_05085 [Rhodospirillales bacterium]